MSMLTMSETAIGALYQILRAHLAANDGLWQTRAHPLEVIPAKVSRPYVVYFVVAGGDGQEIRTERARLVVSVKCVGDTLGDSLAGAERIRAYLDNSGTQDTNPRLPSLTSWAVTTVSIDRVISLVERFEGAQPIYHNGNQFVFTMERLI